jgi:hypothetical protein
LQTGEIIEQVLDRGLLLAVALSLGGGGFWLRRRLLVRVWPLLGGSLAWNATVGVSLSALVSHRVQLLLLLLGPVLAAERPPIHGLVLVEDLLLVDLSAADVLATVDQLHGQVAWLVLLIEKFDFLELLWRSEQLSLLRN